MAWILSSKILFGALSYLIWMLGVFAAVVPTPRGLWHPRAPGQSTSVRDNLTGRADLASRDPKGNRDRTTCHRTGCPIALEAIAARSTHDSAASFRHGQSRRSSTGAVGNRPRPRRPAGGQTPLRSAADPARRRHRCPALARGTRHLSPRKGVRRSNRSSPVPLRAKGIVADGSGSRRRRAERPISSCWPHHAPR